MPKSGATVFAGLWEVIDDLSPEQRKRWDRLSMESDRRSGPVHPLIYSHPATGQKVRRHHNSIDQHKKKYVYVYINSVLAFSANVCLQKF